MERYIFAGVLAVTVLILAAAMLLAPEPTEQPRYLPWDIVVDAQQQMTVFGLTLRRSTLQQAEQRFGEEAEVTLFAKDGNKMVEAFFNSVTLTQIRAKVVITMDLDEETLEGYFQRGVRMAKLGDHSYKVTLGSEDMADLYQQPIGVITYMPKATLTDELIQQRFGEPQQKIVESELGTHWLYPEKGLDLLLAESGKAVLQYIAPSQFDLLLLPLLQSDTTNQNLQ